MKIETYEKNLNRIHEWIKSADQKVSIFIAFETVLIGIILQKLITINFTKSACVTIIFIAGVVILIWSLLKLIMGIIPRTGKKLPKSITYFEAIALMDLGDYKKFVLESEDATYLNEIIEQTHISSKIASKKHSLFREAVLLFILSFILISASYLMYIVYG